MLFFGIFIIFCHRTTLEKNCLKKEYYYYYDEHYKKVPFVLISVPQHFACWRSLGSYPGFEICCSLKVYVEIEPSDSQLVEKAVKALY